MPYVNDGGGNSRLHNVLCMESAIKCAVTYSPDRNINRSVLSASSVPGAVLGAVGTQRMASCPNLESHRLLHRGSGTGPGLEDSSLPESGSEEGGKGLRTRTQSPKAWVQDLASLPGLQ